MYRYFVLASPTVWSGNAAFSWGDKLSAASLASTQADSIPKYIKFSPVPQFYRIFSPFSESSKSADRLGKPGIDRP